jgi:hypothetical protein
LSGGGLLALTLNNMTQGVVLFELGGRLVVCNDQYLRMYGLSPDFVGPGSHLKDIVAERVKTGSLQRDPAEYCAELMDAMAAGKFVRFISQTSDGRAVSVVNRAIPGSNYWVGTHDDITEWRAAERQSALLAEQEAARHNRADDRLVSRKCRGCLKNGRRERRSDAIDSGSVGGQFERDQRAHHCRCHNFQ